MLKKKLEAALLELLIETSNISTKKSVFQQRASNRLNNVDIQHHINALINELQPTTQFNPIALNLKHIGGGKLFKKPNNDIDVKTPVLSVNFRVPNIRVNSEFSEKVSVNKQIDGKIIFSNTKSIDEFNGLKFDSTTLTLSGNTDALGDHEFILYGLLSLANGAHQRVIVKLKVTFVPDPRSLWKNIPSKDTERFHKPDCFDSYCENSHVLLMGSSVRGRSHAHKGIHRDDDFKLFCDESSEWSVCCVADGAGSCKYSRQGAYLAATKATSTLKEALNGHYGVVLEQAYNNFYADKNDTTNNQLVAAYQHTMVKAVFEAAKAIHDCVDSEKADNIKDFSTTLIIAAHKKVLNGYLVLSFWVGDGGIVIYDRNKNVILMGDPDSGEFAGQTRFLDNKMFEDSSVYNRVKMEKVESMTALILATDGITDAWFETEKELETLASWDKFWEELEPHVMNENRDEGLKGLTKWMDFWSKGNHDDRTIAISLVKG
jgi:serine/threonine protein phosphatase PrpC